MIFWRIRVARWEKRSCLSVILICSAVATHALLLMDVGKWQSGPVEEVMQSPLLGLCLGHPIEAVQHGTRTIFLPLKGGSQEAV